MQRHSKIMSLGRILSNQESNVNSPATTTSIIYHGLVVNNDDPEKLKRIQVRIFGVDDNFADSDLPWCISSIPDFFHSIPQNGECVLIMMMNPWNSSYGRIYFGTLQLGIGYNETMKLFGLSNNNEED